MTCPDCGGDDIESTANPFTIGSTKYVANVTKCRSCGFYTVNVYWCDTAGSMEYAGWTKYMDMPPFLASSDELRRIIDG